MRSFATGTARKLTEEFPHSACESPQGAGCPGIASRPQFERKCVMRKAKLLFGLTFLGLLLVIWLLVPGVGGAADKDADKAKEVLIEGFEFKPKSLTIAVGEFVVWKNKDMAMHDATFPNNKELNTGDIKGGGRDSKPVKF